MVNPLGGCLPTLLQMPIWIALFRTLRAAPELYRAPFFGWIQDLSNPDPYFITPVVMGALMFLQQRMTPMTGDSAQAKMMMYFMPIMFTAFMLFLPSGLTLYILVNTVLSITHQTIIHRLRTKKAAAGGA
jgi:YidC/Oxa1 family membrane protein insertase